MANDCRVLKLAFRQTKAEEMVRAASTILFNALSKLDCPLVPLSELAQTPQYGFTESACYEEVGPKFVRITDIQDGMINWDTVPYCRCDDPQKYLLSPNDILFARTGATTGKTYLVQQTPYAIFASYLIRLRPNNSIRPEYLYSFFQSNAYWSQVLDEKEGSAQPNVNGKKLLNIKVPMVDSKTQILISKFLDSVRLRQDGGKNPFSELPPFLADQHRIVALIEELAARIEEARGLRSRAVEEANMVLSSILESIFEIKCNKKWTMKKLIDDHRAIVVAGQHILAGDYNSLGEGTPYLTGPADFGQRMAEIKHWTNTPKTLALPGDILITVKGAGVGKINFAPNSKAAIGRQLMAIRPNQEYLLKEFVYFFLLHRFKHFQSIATATTVPGFKKSDLEMLEIPKVPIHEQRGIISHLETLQSKLDVLKRHQAETSAELDALMPAVLERAFRGEM